MTSILCSIPDPLDTTSLYRAVGPLQHMKRRAHGNVELIINAPFSWATLKAADIVFFQRPALEDRVQAVRMAKLNKKPVWIDYDDNLHAIPHHNSKFSIYGTAQTRHNIAFMIALADVVTVSTEDLGQSFREILKHFPMKSEFNVDPEKIVVVPNAYDPELMPEFANIAPEQRKHVVWRGSASHDKDLDLFSDVIAKNIAESDWTFEFIGEPFWKSMEKFFAAGGDRVTRTVPQDPVSFFHYLKTCAPALVVVPLEDIPFNRSKSCIAWIEATAAGAATLAPNWIEWDKPGVISYGSVEHFDSQLRQAMQIDRRELSVKRQMSVDYISKNQTISHMSEKRSSILDISVRRF